MNNRSLIVFLFTFVLLAAAGCSQATPVIIPTLTVPTVTGTDTAPISGAITASAEIVPAETIDLGFSVPGLVSDIKVSEGSRVKVGDTLAVQENIAQLQAVLDSCQQNLLSAQKSLENLEDNAPLALASAQQEMVRSQKVYDDAVKGLKRKDYRRCSKETIDLYYQKLTDAEDHLKKAREENDNSMYSLERLREAQNVYDIANANYIYCIRYTPQEISESEADLAVADAALKSNTSRYEVLKKGNGIDPDEEARLKAAIASAQSNLETARLALERAVLKAPMAGVVVSIPVKKGQAVVPGQVVMTIASLNLLQVETTDLSERDLPRVSVGQTAVVTVEALGKDFPGKVIKIEPRATKVGGDVVFKVTIQLDEIPESLRWGMSARVQIGP